VESFFQLVLKTFSNLAQEQLWLHALPNIIIGVKTRTTIP